MANNNKVHKAASSDSVSLLSSTSDSVIQHKIDIIRQFSLSKKGKNVVIVTTGKSGVGKSALVNNFLGLEGDKARKSCTQAKAVTTEVDYVDHIINDVNVRVIDIPGLYGLQHKKDEALEILGKLKALTQGKEDVVFFCMDISRRVDILDEQNIDSLHNTYGEKIWKHTIFVLTHADVALGNGSNLEKLVQEFATYIEEELVQKRKVNTTVRSIYSFDTDELSEDAEINRFDGIFVLPVVNVEQLVSQLFCRCSMQLMKGESPPQ